MDIDEIERQRKYQERQKELSARFDREDIQQENADLEAVLSTEAGRRIFASIFGRGYVFGSVFKNCQNDPTKLAYETGRREFAADIYRKANMLQPELTLKAINERNQLFQKRKREFDELKTEFDNEGKGY